MDYLMSVKSGNAVPASGLTPFHPLHYSSFYFLPITSDQSRQVRLQVVEWSYSACKGKIMFTTKALGGSRCLSSG